ncbi:MAG: NAD(P)-binding domain-containing protein [Alphaproteobacteria bacterium]
MNDPIIIIGGGRMGGALATRWRTSLATSAGIHIVEPDAEVRKELAANGSGVHVHAGLADFRLMRGIVVLAVKPQVFELIADDIRKTFAKGSILFVSIMAGVPLAELEDLGARVVRIMPNTPALVGEAMTVACNPKLERGARATITKLFEGGRPRHLGRGRGADACRHRHLGLGPGLCLRLHGGAEPGGEDPRPAARPGTPAGGADGARHRDDGRPAEGGFRHPAPAGDQPRRHHRGRAHRALPRQCLHQAGRLRRPRRRAALTENGRGALHRAGGKTPPRQRLPKADLCTAT